MLEVGNRGALAQELGIGRDRHLADAFFVQDCLDAIAGADRDGRFGNHHRARADHPGKLAHRFEHVGEIRMPVAAPRGGPDGDKHGFGVVDA